MFGVETRDDAESADDEDSAVNRAMRLRSLVGLLATIVLLATIAAPAVAAAGKRRPLCDQNSPLCTEVLNSLHSAGTYTGHDEPALLFYSNTPGSGNSNRYLLTLPQDPPTLPQQDGSGGTFNFQLRATFWFGMAMCDTESAPNFTKTCIPDSDANIFDNADPSAADYIGKHPGTAFMELQFYPPGWVLWPDGNSCDPFKWCAALTIDSLSVDLNTNVENNTPCEDLVGSEPVNFAFITKSGLPHAPPNPVDSTLDTFTAHAATDLFMSSGDQLEVLLHDTPEGFQVVINDLTSHQSGSMTASIANQFGQVKFDPAGTGCTNIPYAFHPMYSTSSEHTRVPWAAHSYNVAFSDEIGHFEFCSAVDSEGGSCTAASATDPGDPDDDDNFCYTAASSSRIQIGGCLDTDDEFDGVSYQPVWPGTLLDPAQDQLLHPTAVVFTSPTFTPEGSIIGGMLNYARVAFETDLPRIEAADASSNNDCDRLTGIGCVNPPLGANFYPIYSTRQSIDGCVWQFGGANIPGTTNTFGGTSESEYGTLLQLVYPDVGGPLFLYNDFRRILPANPCLASGPPAAAPTTSYWGLLALAVILVGLAGVTLRWRVPAE